MVGADIYGTRCEAGGRIVPCAPNAGNGIRQGETTPSSNEIQPLSACRNIGGHLLKVRLDITYGIERYESLYLEAISDGRCGTIAVPTPHGPIEWPLA